MDNKNKKLSPVISKSQDNTERSNILPLAMFDQMKNIRQQYLEITKMPSVILKGIVDANDHWQNLIKKEMSIVENLRKVHQTWLDKINPIQDTITTIQTITRKSLCDVAYQLRAAEAIFSRIDFEVLRSRYNLAKTRVFDMEELIRNVTSSYCHLAESMTTLPEITQLPLFILPRATREVFLTGYTLENISTTPTQEEHEEIVVVPLDTEIKNETSTCMILLKQLDPALLRPYIGAKEAIRSSNIDRVRHFLSSLRELWNHLLRRLAPDNLVKSWIPQDRNHEYLHNGNPTRKTRIIYICRHLNTPPLVEFLIHDTRALVKFIDFFNHIHSLELELTDKQLNALFLKTTSSLIYIIKIGNDTN